jgi:dienelactone hydrolase
VSLNRLLGALLRQRWQWRIGGAALACAAATAAAAVATAPLAPTPTMQAVQIPTASLSNAPAALQGVLFAPTTTAPNGAGVVMLHGCGGAYSKNGSLNARHQMWGDYLAGLGYRVLMLDSLTARGLRELCTIPMQQRPIKEADRVGDAYAALHFLAQQPGIDPQKIALLGWSHGGGVVLNAIGQAPPAPIQAQPTPDEQAHAQSHGLADKAKDADKAQLGRFKAAICFYPGCTARSKAPERFRPYAPLLLLIGEADDWTPAQPCKQLARDVQARGEPMEIVTYEGTYHDFDNPALRTQRLRKDVPNGTRPGQGVTTAPNAAARDDAMQRVRDFLAKNLGAQTTPR